MQRRRSSRGDSWLIERQRRTEQELGNAGDAEGRFQQVQERRRRWQMVP